jgi:hypothetical protein
MKFCHVLRLAIAFASCAPFIMGQSHQAFSLDLPKGPYPVGFRVVQQFDDSRGYNGKYDELGKPYAGEHGRPIQTLIWYPAAHTSLKPMTFGDYLTLNAGEEGTPHGNVDNSLNYIRSLFKPTLADVMWATRDVPMESGRYPVVIYAPSFSASPFENADLCEYLASHGYVVIASPDLGAHARSMTSDQAGISAQVSDISFLIGYAGTLPDTDMSAIAVAGYSWGGISNLFAAARDSRIDALVYLDGSARYFPKLVKDADDVHPETMSIPMLFFTGSESTLEEMARRPPMDAPNVLNELKYSDVTIVRMHWMSHGDFSSFFHRAEESQPPPPGMPAPMGTLSETAESYDWVSRYTLEFLNETLKHDASAAAFLKRTPAENGVPAHMLSAESHSAAGPAPTVDNFRGEVGREDFDHLGAVYAEFRKQSPEFTLPEGEVNAWGYGLVNDDHPKEAIAVMKFNTENYPKSTNAWDALGEAYRNAGNMAQAIKAYQMAVAIDPHNDAVLRKLRDHDATK